MRSSPDPQPGEAAVPADERPPAWPVVNRCRRVVARLREFAAAQVELHERMALIERPWDEELLHWSDDGDQWQLHGHLPPPEHGRRTSTTRRGWCPGRRTSRAR